MTEPWHRRHALNIAGQLPENYDDAVAILEYARVVLEGVYQPAPLPREGGCLVSLAAASASRRSKSTDKPRLSAE